MLEDGPAAKRQHRSEGVYVLRLKSGALYVGESKDLEKRMLSHRKDPNSWVRINGGPEEDLGVTLTKRLDDVADWEEKETLLQMLVHGPDYVRGAQYTSEQVFTHSDKEKLARSLCQHAGACFTCGRLRCRARDCTAGPAPWLARFRGSGLSRRSSGAGNLIRPGCSFSSAVRVIIEHETAGVATGRVEAGTDTRAAETGRVEAVTDARETQLSWTQAWLDRAAHLDWEVGEGGHYTARLDANETVIRLLPATSWTNVFALHPTQQNEFWLLQCSSDCGLGVDFWERNIGFNGESSFLIDFNAIWPQAAVQVTGQLTFLIHADDTHVWAVDPRQVRQEMVHVGAAMNIAEVEDILTRSQLEALKPSCPRKQSKITVRQDPPGSGKTYAIVRYPLCPELYPEYKLYDTFIYITKPHSAKEVVHREFKEQLSKVPHASVIREETKNNGYWKELSVAGRTVHVFFVTGDSLFYVLGKRHKGVLDVFEGICQTIATEGPQTGPRGSITLKGKQVNLCARTLVCMDEATKFSFPYAKALARIVFACNSDAVIAGDCLQSIETKDNVIAYALECKTNSQDPFPGSDTIVELGDKIRRSGRNLVDVIGHVVPWNDFFNLPIPVPAEDVRHEGEGEFTVQLLYREEDNATKIDRVLCTTRDAIMNLFLLPNDILCVFLFVSKNPFGDALRDAFHYMWRELLDDPKYRQKMLLSRRGSDAEKYFNEYDAEILAGRYVWLACFHSSEEGRPIQTKDSEHSTRMVSVHAAQGDGRRLVFIFQLDEMAIRNVYTRGEKNLCYYSFINVACSRAKVRMVAFKEDIYDDIWHRFLPYMDRDTRLSVDPFLRISSCFKMSRVSFQDSDSSLVRSLNEALLPYLEEADKVKDSQPLVDFQHHQVRASTFHLIILLRILNEKNDGNVQMQPIFQILKKLCQLSVIVVRDHREYHSKLRADILDCIPILNYARSPVDPFSAICTDICERLQKQQRHIKLWIQGAGRQQEVTPLVNALTKHPKDIVVLMYAIECAQKKQELTLKMDAVYDIFKSFAAQDSAPLKEHYICLNRAGEVADNIVTTLGGGGEWQLYLNVTLGQPNSELPSGGFHFSKQITYVRVTESEVTVVECRQQISTAHICDLSSALTGQIALIRQPAKAQGGNYERLTDKKVSFLLVSMCTGWMGHVTGFEDLFQHHKDSIFKAVCNHAKHTCSGFHESVLDFHECCSSRGESSIDKFRALKAATPPAWAPTYVEDSLLEIDSANDREPLPEFGRTQLKEFLNKKIEKAANNLYRSLAPTAATAAVVRV